MTKTQCQRYFNAYFCYTITFIIVLLLFKLCEKEMENKFALYRAIIILL